MSFSPVLVMIMRRSERDPYCDLNMANESYILFNHSFIEKFQALCNLE